jgi:hypothetical protein
LADTIRRLTDRGRGDKGNKSKNKRE